MLTHIPSFKKHARAQDERERGSDTKAWNFVRKQQELNQERERERKDARGRERDANTGQEEDRGRKSEKEKGERDEKGANRDQGQARTENRDMRRKKGAPFCAICPNVGANFPRYTKALDILKHGG